MFVLEVVTALTTVILIRDLVTGGGNLGFDVPDHPVAVVHGAVRQLRRSRRRGPRQGAGRRACARRAPRPGQAARPAETRRATSWCPAPSLKVGDVVLVEAGDIIPSDGEVIEGHRLGQRGGDHRRIRAGHPRVRRRPLGGDRRHAGALRLDQGAHHGGAGLDLPRPHDPAGRGRRAAEDAERDRAQHPAGRPDHHLRVRHRDDPELRGLCGRHHLGRRPGGAVRDADPDHHRRAAVGDRHRRHGPAGALQRAGHVGPRGRGGGRRRHAAARQDRHHHARQPPGDRVQARCAA